MINKINTNIIKDFAFSIKDTFQRKPVKSILLTATIVATIALTILFPALLFPLISIPALIVITGSFLIAPAGYSFLIYQDIKDSLFALFKKQHSPDKITDKDVVLILEAEHDHNGAFQSDQRDHFNRLKEKYTIAVEKVSNPDHIGKSINKIVSNNNRIKAIWFRAHGCPHGMQLSEKGNDLTISNVHLLKHIIRKMDPKGVIILDSCSTAGISVNKLKNIAQTIAEIAKGRKVIAPTQNTDDLSIEMDKKNPLNIKFWVKHPTTTQSVWKKPLNFINEIKYLLFKATKGRGIFKNLALDVTKTYLVS